MDYKKAIEQRTSRRTYLDKPIEKSIVQQLMDSLAAVNNETGLNMQLYVDNGDAFVGLKMSYGIFKNVHNYIALVGKKSDVNLVEKIGYFGEKIILEATLLGIGTCWVGGTYDKKSCKCSIGEDETLLGIITLGYVPEEHSLKERFIYSIIHRRTKKIDEMLTSDCETPEWISQGMRAVQKAPSAANQQPVRLTYKEGKLSSKVKVKIGYEIMDLGIAKLHFEIGTDNIGKWNLGNNSEFKLNK